MLYYAGIPILSGLVFLLLVFAVRVIMWKNPKFDKWVNEVWPNHKQREVMVMAVIIGFFVWMIVR